MKNIIKYSLVMVSLLLGLTSCDTTFDDYDSRSQILSGTVTNAMTGTPFISGGNKMIRYTLKEISYSDNAPVREYGGRDDGTFLNSKLFNATYEFVLKGPFLPVDPLEIKMDGDQVRDFTVIPNLGFTDISAVRSADRTEITLKFKYKRHPDVEAYPLATKTMWGRFGLLSRYENVSDGLYETKVVSDGTKMGYKLKFYDANGADDAVVMSTEHSITFIELDPNIPYYVLAGGYARFMTGWNYSEAIKVD